MILVGIFQGLCYTRFDEFLLGIPKSGTRDPVLLVGPDTRDPKGGIRDPRSRTLKVDFQKIFSVFSEAGRL